MGGLAGVNQYLQHEEPFWTQQLARLVRGAGADIVPFDRAGVPGAEMLRLMQLGVLPFGTVLMSALAGRYPQYAAADLPGIGAGAAGVRAAAAAFRPTWKETCASATASNCWLSCLSSPGAVL